MLKVKMIHVLFDNHKENSSNTPPCPASRYNKISSMMLHKLSLVFLCCLFTGLTYSQKFFEVETVDMAQATIFFVEDENVCDLKVWFVYEEEHITGPGLWMEVPEESQADIKIIFVDDVADSDMTICMGLNETEAGWLNEDKKILLE